MKLSFSREVDVPNTIRVRQLEGVFDVPKAEKQKLNWEYDLPDDIKGDKPLASKDDWQIGLIVGPSGSGKTTLAYELYGADKMEEQHKWTDKAVIDDFAKGLSVSEISDSCMSVGFNTIPAWLRPYSVLSNGEQFRVNLARKMLEAPKAGTVVMDEFTSVVDRQVAKIGANAVHKYLKTKRKDLRFVAVSCHYDVIDWLRPDWVIDASQQSFERRSVQSRPEIEVEIWPVEYAAWKLFAPFHYLTANLHKAARCFALYIDKQIAAFTSAMHRPHPIAQDIMGLTRTVTLPDFQGLGLAFVLKDQVGAAYRAVGKRLRSYPAHPAFIRAHDRSRNWKLVTRMAAKPSVKRPQALDWTQGFRTNATFEYVGPAMDRDQAYEFLKRPPKPPKNGKGKR